ncbi:ATP-binding protein [Yunchengibacter salinarum]|uniref:ATP-binding protein n=1 Tax=Yunchengibacter salinarum TaxID=3133399 RepID=UPI0035B6A0BE
MSESLPPIVSALLNALPGAVAVFDIAMRYCDCNDKWIEQNGWRTKDDVIGQSHYDLLPDLPERWRETHRRALNGETLKSDIDRFDRADGTMQHLSWYVSPWHQSDGTIGGVIMAFQHRHDAVAELERERKNRERLQFALEGARDGLFDHDVPSNDAYYSPRWMTMLGYSPDELPQNADTFWSLMHPDDRDRVAGDVNTWLARGSDDVLAFDVRLRCKDGSYRWIMSRGVAVVRNADGDPVRIVGTHTDVTDRKSLEQALSDARRAAENANHAKSAFLANMSHEIRTPLNGILGMADLLDEMSLSEEARDNVAVIRRSGRALLDVINDILDLSRLESGRLTLNARPFSLRDLVASVCSLLSPMANEKGLDLTHDIDSAVPDRLSGDATRLRQILVNLLGNAVKFTESGWVRLKVGRDHDGLIRFVVADSGPGIAEDVQRTLFSRFTQGDTTRNRRHQGAGLGLAIVKQLSDLMNGGADLRSAEGVGTEVTVRLPLNVAEAGQVAASAAEYEAAAPVSGTLDGLDVLVAEDNEVNRHLCARLLFNVNITPRFAANGHEAVAAHQHQPADLILMDIQMPGMDGVEATRCIRSVAGAVGQVPIVALTANALNGQRMEYLEAGMNDVVTKPIDRGALYVAMARATGRAAPENRPGPATGHAPLSGRAEAALDSLLRDEAGR